MSPTAPYRPPGSADPTPRAIAWFRLYAGAVAAAHAGAAVLSAAVPALSAGASSPPRLPLVALFGALAALHALGAWAPRRPWAWTLALVLLAFGLSSCTIVAALPLLLAWRSPLVRAAFRRL